MCSLKSCFHDAGGSTEAEGVVVDMVRKTRERRVLAMREAMMAILEVKSIKFGVVCWWELKLLLRLKPRAVISTVML